MLALPPKQTLTPRKPMSALCHVWTAPSWQELSSRLQHWSVQPAASRPLSAAHGAAGHNALRGSGPDQKHAFDNALAQVGLCSPPSARPWGIASDGMGITGPRQTRRTFVRGDQTHPFIADPPADSPTKSRRIYFREDRWPVWAHTRSKTMVLRSDREF